MTSLFKPPPCLNLHAYSSPISLHYSSSIIFCFPFYPAPSFNLRLHALKTGSDGSDLIRKPIVSSEKELDVISEDDGDEVVEEEEEEVHRRKRGFKDKEDEEWIDWEDQILEDTVPLVGFVRMILHSGKYENGDRLNPEHEATILERLLPYHPEYKKKIGCGIDYITVGNHPDYETSRCMFIVRKDGQRIDFSYWKCIKGLIRKNYPLYADSFILRHFRRRRRS